MITGQFDEITSQLPVNFGDEKFIFNNSHFPLSTNSNLITDEVIITKKWHYYNDTYRIEMLDISTQKAIYKILGLFIIETLFTQKQILIHLNNEASFIKHIRIGNTHPINGLLHHQNTALHYWAAEVYGRYPFQNTATLPNFYLTHLEERSIISEQDWISRDTLHINGTDESLALLAELLLNIGHEKNDIDEVVLESNVGYGGVSAGSVEIRFWLPNSIGFMNS